MKIIAAIFIIDSLLTTSGINSLVQQVKIFNASDYLVHVTPYGSTGNEYQDEGRAFTAEKKARKDYIKEVYKEEPK